MHRDTAQFEFRLSPEMANEIDLLRRQLGNAHSLTEAVNRLILRGLAGAWEQTNEVCKIAYERAKSMARNRSASKRIGPELSTCDDALSRVAKLASQNAVWRKEESPV